MDRGRGPLHPGPAPAPRSPGVSFPLAPSTALAGQSLVAPPDRPRRRCASLSVVRSTPCRSCCPPQDFGRLLVDFFLLFRRRLRAVDTGASLHPDPGWRSLKAGEQKAPVVEGFAFDDADGLGHFVPSNSSASRL